MSSHRALSWSAALRDMKNDRAALPDIREERLHATAGLRGTPPVALSAWRGHSGRRYVVVTHDLTLDALETSTNAVCIAVARAESGIARIVDATTGLSRTEAVEWLCHMVKAGATELHVHRLAEIAAERAGIVVDLSQLPSVIDTVGDLLSRPEHWTRGALARDTNGSPVSPESPSAVCWCINGAIERAVAGDADLADLVEAHFTKLAREDGRPFLRDLYTSLTQPARGPRVS